MSAKCALLVALLGLTAGCAGQIATPVPNPGRPNATPAVVQHGGSTPQWETFALPPHGNSPAGITGGIRGQIWFTEVLGNSVDRLRIGTGQITRFLLPAPNSLPGGIAVGPDGNVWFTEEAGRIGRITSEGTITEFPLGSGRIPGSIADGPDGSLWFTDTGSNSIGQISLTGTVNEFPVPSGATPLQITAGSDGNLWFTETASSVGRATPSGTITEYRTPTKVTSTIGITTASDGNVWFGESPGHRLGRVTPAGQVSDYYVKGRSPDDVVGGGPGAELFVMLEFDGLAEYNIRSHHFVIEGFPPGPSSPGALALGSDGNIWFVEAQSNAIAVFVRNIISVTPTSLALTLGQNGTLAATEPTASAPLRAKSSNVSVATVAPAGSNTFTVTATGAGSCTVTVSDHKGNSFPVPVTVQ